MASYECPACQQEFSKRAGKNCPNCGVELNYERTLVDGKVHYVFSAANPADMPVVATKPAVVESAGRLVSKPDEIPEIRYMGKKKIATKNGFKEVDYYTVKYEGIIHLDWVYCPGCWRKLFQNRVMDSGYFAQDMVCQSCNSFIEFWFITKSQWRPR